MPEEIDDLELLMATEIALRQHNTVMVPTYSFSTHTIANKAVSLYTADNVLRTYGYLMYDGIAWINRLKRHFNASIFAMELLTDASGYDLLGPAPTLLLEYTLT